MLYTRSEALRHDVLHVTKQFERRHSQQHDFAIEVMHAPSIGADTLFGDEIHDQSLYNSKCLLRAKSHNVDWLAAIDIDEFFVGNFEEKRRTPASLQEIKTKTTPLATYLKKVPANIDGIDVQMFECFETKRKAAIHKFIVRPQFVSYLAVHARNFF